MIGRIFKGIDVALNIIFNGRTETISARAGRAKKNGHRWGRVLCKFLNAVDGGHCEDADSNSPFRDVK